MTLSTVKSRIISMVVQRSEAVSSLDDLPDSTNLIQDNLLDSINFVSLLSDLETEFNVSLDLIDEPIETFVVLGSLAQCIVSQLQSSRNV